MLAVLALLYRPLVLSTLSPDLARARGVRVRLIGACGLLTMGIAVLLSAITIGAVLSTARSSGITHGLAMNSRSSLVT